VAGRYEADERDVYQQRLSVPARRSHLFSESVAMYQKIQLVLVAILALVFGLSALSRRFPDVAWLYVFRYERPQLSDAQRDLMRRRSNIYAGIELILMGIALPMLYAAVTMMFFSEVTTMATILVLAGSVFCIGLGVTGIWRSRRG
jgi:hypothetical protein